MTIGPSPAEVHRSRKLARRLGVAWPPSREGAAVLWKALELERVAEHGAHIVGAHGGHHGGHRGHFGRGGFGGALVYPYAVEADACIDRRTDGRCYDFPRVVTGAAPVYDPATGRVCIPGMPCFTPGQTSSSAPAAIPWKALDTSGWTINNGQENACQLFEASAFDANGIADGYEILLMQDSAGYARAMGLPFDPRLTDGTLTPVPSQDVCMGWIVDNGSYLVTGQTTATPWAERVYGMSQGFDARRPLFNDRALFGQPTNALAKLIARYGQAFGVMAKAVASLLGAAASVTAVLSVIGSLGGPLATIATAITHAIATGVATVTAAVSSLTAAASGLGIGSIPIVITALAILVLSMLPQAESPSLHVTRLDPGSGLTVWASSSGVPVPSVLAERNPHLPFVPPGDFGQVAPFENVDAETFFAGLVYLRTVLQPWRLDLVWTQRVPDAGIAAFRAARSSGASISDAIGSAAGTAVGYPNAFERNLMKVVPANLVAIQGNAAAMQCLQTAHKKNEDRARAYLHSAAFLSSPDALAAPQIGQAAGLAHLTHVSAAGFRRPPLQGAH